MGRVRTSYFLPCLALISSKQYLLKNQIKMKRKNGKQNVFGSCFLFIHEHLTNESSEGNEDAYAHSSCGHIEDDSGGLNLEKRNQEAERKQ